MSRLEIETNGFHSEGQMDEEFEEISIEVPWGHIVGKWWGRKDIQPVLAIHGWQDNAGTFDTLAPLLIGPKVSILCIDLPGHGFSSHYPKGQTYYIFWDGVYHVRRIVKHFKWEKFSIMGHSLGGAIGFLYASIYPDEVDKLISLDIVCPPVRDIISTMGETIDLFFKYEALKPEACPQYEYDDMIDITVDGHNNKLTRASCEILMRRGMRPTPEDKSIYRFTRDIRLKSSIMSALTLEQAYAFAVRISCNVLNIRATIHSIQLEYYESVLDKIRTNAKVEYHLVNGTHHVHLNNPERVSGIISKFLKS
uniref:AB hydrolase-1 domain-containing protein n=2 Tax=Photinus pyralis TaxID=7054 RepID=A0A1Y1LD67_PHOPY